MEGGGAGDGAIGRRGDLPQRHGEHRERMKQYSSKRLVRWMMVVRAALLAGCLGTEPKMVRTLLPSATLTLSEDAPGAEALVATVTAIPLPS
jgi:hypothetical protein